MGPSDCRWSLGTQVAQDGRIREPGSGKWTTFKSKAISSTGRLRKTKQPQAYLELSGALGMTLQTAGSLWEGGVLELSVLGSYCLKLLKPMALFLSSEGIWADHGQAEAKLRSNFNFKIWE